MTIMESNKIIADFMSQSPTGFFDTLEDAYKNMPYNSDWNWLMPVVKKIVSHGWLLKDIPYQTKLITTLQTADITKIYSAVVDFIKFNKKEN